MYQYVISQPALVANIFKNLEVFNALPSACYMFCRTWPSTEINISKLTPQNATHDPPCLAQMHPQQ